MDGMGRVSVVVPNVDHHDSEHPSRPDFAAGATVRCYAAVAVLHRACQETCDFVGAADHALVQSQSAQSSASLEVQATRDAPQ